MTAFYESTTPNTDAKSRFAQLFFQAAGVQLESLRQLFHDLEQAGGDEERRRELLAKAVGVSEQVAEHLRWAHYQLTHSQEQETGLGTSRLGISGLRVPPPNPANKGNIR